MKKIICILIVMLFQNILLGQLKPCDKIDLKSEKSVTPVHVLTGPAQSKSGYRIQKNGIWYIVILDRENRISELSVDDSTFMLSNLRIGSIYSEIDPSRIVEEGMIPGFGYYVKLDDGWKVMLVNREIIENRVVSSSSLITGFVKDSYGCTD